MSQQRIIYVMLFSIACFLVFAYPVGRMGSWAGGVWDIGWGGTLIVWVVGFLGMRYSFNGPRKIVRYIVVHWMGVSFIFATLTAIAEIVRLFVTGYDQTIVLWILVLGVLANVLAIAVSHHLQIKRIEIRSQKLSKSSRVVQISDVHIGSRQSGFMARVVARINLLSPDFVVITGDLIDTSAVEIEALQALLELKAKTFFSVGNHERYADLPKAIEMLEQLGVIPLRQCFHIEDELQFLGIDDAEHSEQVADHLPGMGVVDEHFSILLYHRPHGWESAIEHGIDLMLSGHTHNGQIFPFNWLVKQQFPRINGLHKSSSSHLYVSSGTGTWGPLMRLGSMNEISCFDLLPEK